MPCFLLQVQVLTYAQQSKEQANIELDRLAKRIQEFRTQSELAQMQASDNLAASASAMSTNAFGMSAYKSMEAIMQSTTKGEVSFFSKVLVCPLIDEELHFHWHKVQEKSLACYLFPLG